MRVAVVGAGPSGSEVAARLASAGVETALYDRTFDREKPCGGGIPWRGLEEFGELVGPDLPACEVRRFELESPSGEVAVVETPSPLRIFSRRTLDARWAERAHRAGAVPRQEKVVSIVPRGGPGDPPRVVTASGSDEPFDLVVGADGARSTVRRSVSRPFPTGDLSQAVGFYLPERSGDIARLVFPEGIPGYLWCFPRIDHLAVGACAPLGPGVAARLWKASEDYVRRIDPGLDPASLPRYSALIPSLSPESLRNPPLAGPGWLLVGDAAGTVDPLTREGIYHGLRSAALAAESILDGRGAEYARAWDAVFGEEFRWAAARRERFFAPELTERLVRYLNRSERIRGVMSDLILGRQPYRTLKGRLLRAGVSSVLLRLFGMLRAS